MLYVRRIIIALLLGGSMLGVILVGAITPTFAASNASNAKATTFARKADCGSPNTNFTSLGFVNFHRQGNTVAVNYHLKNAQPNATYIVELWQAPCNFVATFGSVTTNSNGVGNGNFEVTVPSASTQFFATSLFGGFFNDTTTVTLP